MLTDFCNIWQLVYGVNLQYKINWFTHLIGVLLLHNLGKKSSA